MSASSPLARVGDVIEHGQDIPGNVTQMSDSSSVGGWGRWVRSVNGRWNWATSGHMVEHAEVREGGCHDSVMTDPNTQCAPYRVEAVSHAQPITVVEVDPEQQPADDDEPETHFWLSGNPLTWCGLDSYDDDVSVAQEGERPTCRRCLIALGEIGPDAPAEPSVPQVFEVPQVAAVAYLTMLNEIAELLGVGPEQDLVAEVKRRLAPPATPQPVVLRLPEVSPDTTLVVQSDEGNDVLFLPTKGGWWRGPNDVHGVWKLGKILDMWGEACPKPREPRTWPKLDVISDDVKAIRGASGKVYHLSHFSQSIPVFREHSEDGEPIGPGRPFHALQTYDGPLDEVVKP